HPEQRGCVDFPSTKSNITRRIPPRRASQTGANSGMSIALSIALSPNWIMIERDFFSSPKSYRVQKTLRRAVSFRGAGLHTGEMAHLKLVPAEPNHGVIF